jgi:hypothetical protein
MNALDIVTIDSGAVGLVTEGDEKACSITWFGGAESKAAWWQEGERGLKVIDNLASVLACGIRHPFSSDKRNPYKVPNG